ncbi:MAG TPA: SMC-Scp complex subunit ScpB, partial [Hyphomicrobium sp.]|nr:SMC-Scp complex subunit ScpB [Hyphomicrobium sp.]
MVPPRLTLVSDNTREKKETAANDEARPRENALPSTLSDPEKTAARPAPAAGRDKLRRLEAMLFAASEPLDAKALARNLDAADDVNALLLDL